MKWINVELLMLEHTLRLGHHDKFLFSINNYIKEGKAKDKNYIAKQCEKFDIKVAFPANDAFIKDAQYKDFFDSIKNYLFYDASFQMFKYFKLDEEVFVNTHIEPSQMELLKALPQHVLKPTPASVKASKNSYFIVFANEFLYEPFDTSYMDLVCNYSDETSENTLELFNNIRDSDPNDIYAPLCTYDKDIVASEISESDLMDPQKTSNWSGSKYLEYKAEYIKRLSKKHAKGGNKNRNLNEDDASSFNSYLPSYFPIGLFSPTKTSNFGSTILRYIDLTGLHLLLLSQRRLYIKQATNYEIEYEDNLDPIKNLDIDTLISLRDKALKSCHALSENLFYNGRSDSRILCFVNTFQRYAALVEYANFYDQIFANMLIDKGEDGGQSIDDMCKWNGTNELYELSVFYMHLVKLSYHLLANNAFEWFSYKDDFTQAVCNFISLEDKIVDSLNKTIPFNIFSACTEFFEARNIAELDTYSLDFRALVNRALSYYDGIKTVWQRMPMPTKIGQEVINLQPSFMSSWAQLRLESFFSDDKIVKERIYEKCKLDVNDIDSIEVAISYLNVAVDCFFYIGANLALSNTRQFNLYNDTALPWYTNAANQDSLDDVFADFTKLNSAPEITCLIENHQKLLKQFYYYYVHQHKNGSNLAYWDFIINTIGSFDSGDNEELSNPKLENIYSLAVKVNDLLMSSVEALVAKQFLVKNHSNFFNLNILKLLDNVISFVNISKLALGSISLTDNSLNEDLQEQLCLVKDALKDENKAELSAIIKDSISTYANFSFNEISNRYRPYLSILNKDLSFNKSSFVCYVYNDCHYSKIISFNLLTEINWIISRRFQSTYSMYSAGLRVELNYITLYRTFFKWCLHVAQGIYNYVFYCFVDFLNTSIAAGQSSNKVILQSASLLFSILKHFNLSDKAEAIVSSEIEFFSYKKNEQFKAVREILAFIYEGYCNILKFLSYNSGLIPELTAVNDNFFLFKHTVFLNELLYKKDQALDKLTYSMQDKMDTFWVLMSTDSFYGKDLFKEDFINVRNEYVKELDDLLNVIFYPDDPYKHEFKRLTILNSNQLARNVPSLKLVDKYVLDRSEKPIIDLYQSKHFLNKDKIKNLVAKLDLYDQEELNKQFNYTDIFAFSACMLNESSTKKDDNASYKYTLSSEDLTNLSSFNELTALIDKRATSEGVETLNIACQSLEILLATLDVILLNFDQLKRIHAKEKCIDTIHGLVKKELVKLDNEAYQSCVAQLVDNIAGSLVACSCEELYEPIVTSLTTLRKQYAYDLAVIGKLYNAKYFEFLKRNSPQKKLYLLDKVAFGEKAILSIDECLKDKIVHDADLKLKFIANSKLAIDNTKPLNTKVNQHGSSKKSSGKKKHKR